VPPGRRVTFFLRLKKKVTKEKEPNAIWPDVLVAKSSPLAASSSARCAGASKGSPEGMAFLGSRTGMSQGFKDAPRHASAPAKKYEPLQGSPSPNDGCDDHERQQVVSSLPLRGLAK